jgi:hypothetical protein
MTTRVVDILIMAPIIPALPLLITWWLPWEKWLSGKIPLGIVGPYILYASFAAWHFKLHWWTVAGLAFWGMVISGIALAEAVGRKRARKQELR